MLATVMRLLLALVRVSGCRLTAERLPEGKSKAEVLAAVAAAKKTLPLKSVLRILGLSPSRYHAWRRLETACQLGDRPSCPKTHPGQLTAQEVATIKEMVTSTEYRHMATSTLAVYAQRVGRVFASASTWIRLVRAHGWRRPRARVYPAKPKVGIRAKKPNEIWHLDVSAPCKALVNRQHEAAPIKGGIVIRKGTAKLDRVPTVGLNQQSGLKCTGCGTIRRRPGYHRVHGETTKHAAEASVLNVQLPMAGWCRESCGLNWLVFMLRASGRDSFAFSDGVPPVAVTPLHQG